ncbi:MAG TPA: BMC domain-containing protein [Candidatus Eisenbacteria bacterium]
MTPPEALEPGRRDSSEPGRPETPTLALLEIGSMAIGYVAADAMVKAAPVELLAIEPVTPGKLLVLVTGSVAAVEFAMEAGRAVAGEQLLDQLFLPQAHPDVASVLGLAPTGTIESLGFFECRTVAAGLLSADAAAKASDIRLLTILAARGIGRRTLTLFTGTLHDVEASLAAGNSVLAGRGGALAAVVIPRAHPDFIERLLHPLEVL